jgi:hypothetical protein
VLERNNIPYAKVVGANLTGWIEGTPAELAVKSAALTNAVRLSYRDLTLRLSGQVVQSMLNAGSTTGVRCVDGPNWPLGENEEFATRRTFTLRFEAEYPYYPAGRVVVTDWKQTISVWGGEPVVVFLPSVGGPPQAQQTAPTSTFKAIQAGSAVSEGGYAVFPSPLLRAERFNAKRDVHSPMRKGQGLSEYMISWSYEYESVSRLSALPGVPPVP